MKKYNLKHIGRQAGMTLIELTVVLLILIGLAGLLVPYVSGFVARTHDSTTASSISELNNAIQRFQTQRQSLPNGMDLLVETGTNQIYAKLMNSALLVTTATNATHVSSLSKAGVTKVFKMKSATDNATFKATELSNITISTTATPNLAVVNSVNPATGCANWFPGGACNDENHLSYMFGGIPDDYVAGQACHDYVAFGIGDNSTLNGSAGSMQNAPVHFSEAAQNAPDKKYGHYMAVFKVQNKIAFDGSCPDQPQPAKFVGVVMNMDFAALVGPQSNLSWVNQRLTSN